MKRRFRRRNSQADPFIDLLFNALLGFTFLFLIAVMFVNPQARKGSVDLKAEYIISVTWPDHLPDDIDIWVEDPHGAIVSYVRKDVAWLHLDRDDRGEVNDTIMVDGKEVIYPINQEVVTIRGIIQGEYVVNLNYYKASGEGPFDALVKVEKVNPTLKTIYVQKVPMVEENQEVTVVRFTLDAAGELSNLNTLPKSLVPTEFEADPILWQ